MTGALDGVVVVDFVRVLAAPYATMLLQASVYISTGQVPSSMGNRHPSIAPHEVFATADRPLAVAAANDKLFGRLVDGLGRPDLQDDPRFVTNTLRVAHRDELVEELEAPLRQESAEHWYERLSDLGVPCGPINDLAQAFALAERLGLDPVAEVEDEARGQPVRQVANPISLSATPVVYSAAPPLFLEPQVFEPRTFEPQVFEPQVLAPDAFEPDAFEPKHEVPAR